MNAVTADNDSELRDLYRELILDHARNPRHFGKLETPTQQAAGINPLCGDKLTLYLHVDGDRIAAVAFEGSGCAISMASASLLTDIVQGLEVAAARRYFEAVTKRMTGKEDAGLERGLDLGKIRALDGVREFPSRVKCATLAWHALNSALDKKTSPVTTE